jgi:hypothetical protein
MAHRYKLIDLPARTDIRGTLGFAQAPDHIPFTPVRIFILYGMQPGAERGDHAHRAQHQYMIMMHGSATIEIDDGATRSDVKLDKPSLALYVPPMLWLRLRFSADAVCAVLASDVYDEADYVRSYEEFVALTKGASAK